VFAVALNQLDGFAGALTQVIQFCPSCFAASNRLDVSNVGRMEREDSLHALIIDDSPHREGFVDTPSLAGDYRAGKNLCPLFVAFLDAAMDVHNIAYFKVRYIFLETFTFNGIQHFGFHRHISCQSGQVG